jgi:hypothetical protein
MRVAYTNGKPLKQELFYFKFSRRRIKHRKMDNKNNLENEKDKLNKLIGEAYEKGSSLAQNDTIMEHSRKVDELIVKAQKQKQRHKKSRQDR